MLASRAVDPQLHQPAGVPASQELAHGRGSVEPPRWIPPLRGARWISPLRGADAHVDLAQLRAAGEQLLDRRRTREP